MSSGQPATVRTRSKRAPGSNHQTCDLPSLMLKELMSDIAWTTQLAPAGPGISFGQMPQSTVIVKHWTRFGMLRSSSSISDGQAGRDHPSPR